MTPVPDCSDDEDDSQLLKRIASARDDPLGAQAAAEKFYLRHMPCLKRACHHYGRRLRGAYGLKDLVADTLLRAFERASTYKPPDCVGLDQTKYTHKWLVRIASNLFFDKCEETAEIEAAANQKAINSSKARRVGREPDEPQSSRFTYLRRQAAVFLQNLSPRDRGVLIASLDYYDGTFSPPRCVVAEICSRYGLKRDAYRQLRNRLMDAAKAHFRQLGERVA